MGNGIEQRNGCFYIRYRGDRPYSDRSMYNTIAAEDQETFVMKAQHKFSQMKFLDIISSYDIMRKAYAIIQIAIKRKVKTV